MALGTGGVAIADFIRQQVGDWDDEAIATARFKAFSGQRSDWESRYVFWKDLIFQVARRFNLLIVNPSEVMKTWFTRGGGLAPLCLDQVLVQMYKDGEIRLMEELVDPKSGHLSRFFSKAMKIVRGPCVEDSVVECPLILMPLLKEKSAEVVNVLSQSHWTSSCVITLDNFQILCGGSKEASAIFRYLSEYGKARYLVTKKTEVIEGLKVSLSQTPLSSLTSLDYDVLHLIWTTENLQKQLDVIDQRYADLKSSTLTSLRNGNRTISLRHARQMKLVSQSREKCASLLNRVEEVLTIIANAESTKKVSEAIIIGSQAIKENGISVTEVEHCLQEVNESVDAQKQINTAIESSQLMDDIDDEDVEEELLKLDLDIMSEHREASTAKNDAHTAEENKSDASESLCDDLSKLNISPSTEFEAMSPLGGKRSHLLQPEVA